ncbi:MAG TPA: DUF4390 domain-containing protein [bacterium]|nr:DUF4390 domain-containing protein [bacterium]
MNRAKAPGRIGRLSNERWTAIKRLVFALILCLALGSATIAEAKARIEGTSCSRNGQVFSVHFHVVEAFTPDMERAILSGIPHTFIYHFEIMRIVPAWPNIRIHHWQVRRTLRYDTLKKTYTVDFGDGNRPKQADSLDEAKRMMTEFVGYPVAVGTSLDRSFNYYVRIKAQLDPVKWPLMLDKIFFFVTMWDFETDWVQIELPLHEAQGNGR